MDEDPKLTQLAPVRAWARLCAPGPFWAILGHSGPFWAILGPPGRLAVKIRCQGQVSKLFLDHDDAELMM